MTIFLIDSQSDRITLPPSQAISVIRIDDRNPTQVFASALQSLLQQTQTPYGIIVPLHSDVSLDELDYAAIEAALDAGCIAVGMEGGMKGGMEDGNADNRDKNAGAFFHCTTLSQHWMAGPIDVFAKHLQLTEPGDFNEWHQRFQRDALWQLRLPIACLQTSAAHHDLLNSNLPLDALAISNWQDNINALEQSNPAFADRLLAHLLNGNFRLQESQNAHWYLLQHGKCDQSPQPVINHENELLVYGLPDVVLTRAIKQATNCTFYYDDLDTLCSLLIQHNFAEQITHQTLGFQQLFIDSGPAGAVFTMRLTSHLSRTDSRNVQICLNRHFANAEALKHLLIDRCPDTSAQQKAGRAAPKSTCDIVVISPQCAIFNDLALCFQKLQYNTRLVLIGDDKGNSSTVENQAMIHQLGEIDARLFVFRNRCGLETDDTDKRVFDYSALPGNSISWWWDAPNIASHIDYSEEVGCCAPVAFSQSQLAQLPTGTPYLPPGARTAFCDIDLTAALQLQKPIAISFVGQARIDLLNSNIRYLLASFETLDPLFHRSLKSALANNPDVLSMNQTFNDIREPILQKLTELEAALPDQVYYLRYLWEMCETALFRLVTIAVLCQHQIPVHVYGDDQWVRSGIVPADLYKGILAQRDLPDLYQNSKVNLNLNFMQVGSTVNPKVLDIAACGGVCVTDYRPELDQLYPDATSRPFSFNNGVDLLETISQLLKSDLREYQTNCAFVTRKDHSLLLRAKTLAERFIE